MPLLTYCWRRSTSVKPCRPAIPTTDPITRHKILSPHSSVSRYKIDWITFDLIWFWFWIFRMEGRYWTRPAAASFPAAANWLGRCVRRRRVSWRRRATGGITYRWSDSRRDPFRIRRRRRDANTSALCPWLPSKSTALLVETLSKYFYLFFISFILFHSIIIWIFLRVMFYIISFLSIYSNSFHNYVFLISFLSYISYYFILGIYIYTNSFNNYVYFSF